jgi:hypothetical protein
MHWSYERSDYQVADVDGRAVLFELLADRTGLREQWSDLTSEELGESLRLAGYRLADAAETPEGRTPYLGDFQTINGNRQFVGMELAVVVDQTGRKMHLVGGGSMSDGVLDGAVRGGFGYHISVDDGSA